MSNCCSSRVIYSFFGPPGSGKGTLAGKCSRRLGHKVLSTGNLCRKHISTGTQYGKMLDEYISAGRLVPDELIIEMVKDWLQHAVKDCKPIILDGFPRTRRQSEMFFQVLKQDYPNYHYKVVSFEVDDDEVVRRLTNRLVCSNRNCQSVYSATLSPKQEGICDFCQSELMQREDDSEELIRERLKHYPEYRDPLFAYYKSIDLPIERLDVSSDTPEEIFDKFEKIGQNSTFNGLSQ